MKKSLLTAVICLTALSVNGQQTEAERVRAQQERNQIQRQIDAQNQRIERERAVNKASFDKWRRETQFKRLPPDERGAKPTREDFSAHEKFLKQPKTGLFRLFPDIGCNSKRILRADQACENAPIFGYSYSFNRAYFNSGRIAFKNNNLVTEGLLSQGMITSLGDVPLENVSLATAGVVFLADFKPQSDFSEVRKQSAEFEQGIVLNNFRYGKSAMVDVDTTFALRLIDYGVKKGSLSFALKTEPLDATAELFRSRQYSRNLSDITLAFRVVRKDMDGSLIILWKELREQKTPKLDLRKYVKITDLN